MSTISRVKTWASGDVLTASDLNTEFNTIFNDYNGSISNANISGSAAIAYAKLSLASSIVAGDIASNAVTTVKINDSAVTTAKINDAAVTAPKLSLAQAETRLTNNVNLTTTSSLGDTLITHSSLVAGTYIFYGLCACYIDTGADVTGRIAFELNNGTTSLGTLDMPTFAFNANSSTGSDSIVSVGFITIQALASTTTINLAAYCPQAITNPRASGACRLGYLRVG